jgi:hypothetical protein
VQEEERPSPSVDLFSSLLLLDGTFAFVVIRPDTLCQFAVAAASCFVLFIIGGIGL